MNDFRVLVLWPSGSPEEWGHALNTPSKELPRLTAEQKESAKRWGIREEEEQRNVLFQRLVDERLRAEAQTLGHTAADVLEDANYRLMAVLVDGRPDRPWMLRVQRKGSEAPIDIHVPRDVRDRIVREGTGDSESLRQQLAESLGIAAGGR